MTGNYEVIVNTLDKIFTRLYSAMNDYFENIFNAPSTINRIIKYYAIGFDNDKPLERYIMFGGTIVAVFEIKLEYEVDVIMNE